MKIASLLLSLSLVSVFSFSEVPSAHAQTSGSSSSAKKKVLVGSLVGSKTQSARDWIVKGLQEDGRYEVVGSESSLSSKKTDSSSIASAAKEHKADAVILGKSVIKKAAWEAELSIYDGKDGKLIETVTISGKTFGKYGNALVAGDELDEPLAKAGGPAAEAPVAVAPAAAKEEPKAEAPKPEAAQPTEQAEKPAEEEQAASGAAGGRPSPLEIRAGARLYGRAFRYSDSLFQLAPDQGFQELITYNLSAAPMPFGQLTWYPAAHFQDGWLAHLGIRGGYERGVATQVAYQGALLDQDHSLWYAGLRGRIPVLPNLEFGVIGTFTNHTFTIYGDEDSAGVPAFPDVDYKMVEAGADVEWRIDKLILGAYGKYLILFDSGPIQSAEWFPSAHGSGIDFGGNVGWELTPMFDILVGGDVRAYGLDFNPIANDAPPERIAGGATDVYLSMWAGLGFRLPGDQPQATAAPASGKSTGEAAPKGDDFDSFD